MNTNYEIYKEDSPFISLALHDGHLIPPDVLKHIMLKEHERFREEDPYTAYMANLPVNKVFVNTSRFYVDLNRLENQAIYKKPEDAWELEVWKNEFPVELEEKQMDYYHQFYAEIETLIKDIIQKYGYFIILDIHSYNHRRGNPFTVANETENPEINIGSEYNHPRWRSLISNYAAFLSKCTINNHHPDVRENIKFKGGGFSQWVNQHYSEQGCVISIEFKKTFMDEWTGRADIDHIRDIRQALRDSISFLTENVQSALNS